MDQEVITTENAPLPDEVVRSAPAEISQPAQQAAPDTAAQTADPAPAENTDAHPQETPKKGGIQKRIDELTRERYEAVRQAEYWRQQAQAQPAAQPEPVKPPRIDEYQDVNQFLEARDAYIKEQTKAEVFREYQQVQQRQQIEAQQHQQAIQQQQTVQRFVAAEDDARSKYQDYDAAVQSPLMGQLKQVRPDVIQAVIDSPNGADVAYYLAKNPQMVQQIASLNPFAAAREIGRIEQMFMAPKPQASAAPTPPRTVGGKAEVSRNPENMSIAEYRKWRAAKS